MGLFGSSTKTYYSSTSTLLFEEMPSVIKQTVASSITQNRNISKDLITNLTNGIGFRANSLYNYGLSGEYPYGLPDGSIGTLPPNTYNNVKFIIENEIGGSVFLSSCMIDIDPTTSHVWYIAMYKKVVTGVVEDEEYPWAYNESTGIFPLLTLPKEDFLTVSPYFPIIPVRVNEVSQVGEGMPNRDQILRAGNLIGVDIVQIAESIEAQEEDNNENPVEDAYVMLGVEVTDQSKAGMEYLYEFFNLQHSLSTVSELDYRYWLETPSELGTPPMNTVSIADSNYKMELGWLYSTNDVVEGVIGEVGEFTNEYTLHSGDVPVDGDETTTYSTSSIRLRKQITATQYDEVIVVGLVHSNWAVGKELRTTLKDAFDDEDVAQAFVIPLRKDLLNVLGTVKQHDLMYISIRLVLNDKYVQKLKWYQTGFFKFVLLAISVVISLWFPPLGVAAFSAAAAGIALVQVIAMKILLPIVIQALEDLVGEELALLVSVIVSIYAGGGTTSAYIAGAMQTVSGLMGIRFTNAMEEINNELKTVQEDMDDLLAEENETQLNVMNSLQLSMSDTFNVMQADDYVRRFFYEAREPLLIKKLTEEFTNVLRYTDKPSSVIRLGQTV